MNISTLEPLSTLWVLIVIALVMQAFCEGGYRIGQHLRTRRSTHFTRPYGGRATGDASVCIGVFIFDGSRPIQLKKTERTR